MDNVIQIDFRILAIIWTVMTIGISVGAVWGTVRFTLRQYATEINELKKTIGDLKGALYRTDGVTNYLPRSECEKCRMACQDRIDKRLGEIKAIINEGEKNREGAKDKWEEAFRQILGQISKLEGIIQNGKTS
jgi:hypothetical protein